MQLAQVLFKYMLTGDNRPMITMSTEQSLEKVYKALEIIRNGELCTEHGDLESWCTDGEKVAYWWNRILDCLLDAHYDEAHNLVAAELKGDDTATSKRKTRVQSHLMEMNNWFKRSIYWTATLKRNGSQFDMNNQQVFGEVVGVVRPSESIRRGYTVPPWMIVVGLGQGPLISSGVDPSEELRDPDKEVTYYIRAIEDALEKCQEINIPCRLLVFTSATTYHVAFCQRIREHFAQKDKKIWCNYVEAGTPADERKTLFSEFGSSDFSVLLNYQIVHEGINIPSCTGVILGRYMNAVSLIQAIGRARRLMPKDRDSIRHGTITPGDLANYDKPWGLVYHYLDENDADSRTAKENYKELIRELRDINDGEPWWLDRAKVDQLKPRGKRLPGYANPQPKTTDTAEAQYEDQFAKMLYVDSTDLIRIENEERELNTIYSQTKTDNFLSAIGIV
jgi:superfamily II DNA or RNA helicase